MFIRRNDGLGTVFLPFDVAALLLAIWCTLWSGVHGAWVVPMMIGSWLGWFIALLLLYYFVVWLISLTVDTKAPPPAEDHPAYRRIVEDVIGMLCRFARVRIHFTGVEKLPEGRYLIVSNHRSGYDPITTVWALRGRRVAFITKPENHKIPIAGPMIYKANYLPIDREDPRKAMETIRAAAALLKNDVVSVGVYPEGTRSRSGEMLPFHNGVFKIAQKANVPLAVASIRGTEKIKANFPWHITDVYLHICEVLPPEAIQGATSAVSDRVREIIERDLAKAELVLT